jgi:hypothetical protein
MSASHRRCEMLIPLSFNDGSPVPEPLVTGSVLDLVNSGGATPRPPPR